MNCNIDEGILIYALRYALGRQSYAVSDVITAIKNNWEILGDNSKMVIYRDIKNYLNQPYCPLKEEWIALDNYLKNLDKQIKSRWSF